MAVRAEELIQRISIEGADRVLEALRRAGQGGTKAFQDLERAAKSATGGLDNAGRGVDRLDSRVDRMRNRFSSLIPTLMRVSMLLGGAFGARQLQQTADAYTNMDNKIKAATDSSEEHVKVMGMVREMSNETRSSITDNAQAFVRFNLMMGNMGKSSEDTIAMLTTLNKALQISGVGGMEASAGIRQLAQAFGSGRLQGDEFRSIMENLPPVAQALADTLTNGSIPALREMAKDGEITAERIEKALSSIAKETDRKFAEMEKTIGSALIVLNNEWITWIGEMNKSIGVSSTMSELILKLADNFHVLGGAIIGVTTVIALSLIPWAGRFIKLLTRNWFIMLIGGISALIAYFYRLREESPLVEEIFSRLGELAQKLGDYFLAFATRVRNVVAELTGGNVTGVAVTWTDVGNKINDVLKLLIDNVEATGAAILTFVGFIGGAMVVGALQKLIGLFRTLRIVTIAWNMVLLLNPIVRMITIAIALGAAIGGLARYLYDSSQGFRDWAASAVKSIQGVIDWARRAIRWLKEMLGLQGSAPSGGAGGGGYAAGGPVFGGGTETSDSIPARLSRGEYVIRAAAVRNYGAAFFDALNRIRFPRSMFSAFDYPRREPAYAGLNLAGGGLAGPASTEPYAVVNLTMDGQRYEMMAPRSVADRLIRHSVSEETSETGRKPGWWR